MIRNIVIDGQSVPMLATGATPYRYKSVFREDLMRLLMESGKDGAEGDTSFIAKLAYIMAKQAEGADMARLNEDTFLAWLDQFEPLSVPLAGEEIMDLYAGSSAQTSAEKKKDAPPTGR